MGTRSLNNRKENMDLRNSITPKVDVEIPSTLEVSEHMIPAIKDWAIGDKYLVNLEVQMTSTGKADSFSPNSSIRSRFDVIAAEVCEEKEDDGMEEMQEKANMKKSFLRAMARFIGRM